MNRTARLFVVAALMISIGLPWAALQSVAWVGMALSYSVEKGSVIEGLSDTFDGKHPCPLCHAVSSGQEKEKKQQHDKASSQEKKLEMLPGQPLSLSLSLWMPKRSPAQYASLKVDGEARRNEPPLPPPRIG